MAIKPIGTEDLSKVINLTVKCIFSQMQLTYEFEKP